MTERLHLHFSLSCIGEGNGSPLQCSCLENLQKVGEGNGIPLQHSCLGNPMDGGAWWTAGHGVTKSRTWLSDFTFTLHFHALEKEIATHSNVLAWRIPGMGEPGGLPSLGSHRVRHEWSYLAAAAAVVFWIIVLSGYMPRSGASELYGNSSFSFLRNLHTVFYGGCASFMCVYFCLLRHIFSYS